MKTIALIITIMLALNLGAASADNFTPLRFKNTEVAPPKNPIMKVVMVHGFLETGTNFKKMKDHLHKHQIACQIIKLKPSDGRGGLDKLAKDLKQQINSHYGDDCKIAVIGFSMGGLVSRYYLQELGGASRCESLITISSPHHGTNAAYLYPSKGVKQMRPGSNFLKVLKKSEDQLSDIPVVSYRTPLDLVILPSKNSDWKRAENVKYNIILHPMMLTSRKVIHDIRERLVDTAS